MSETAAPEPPVAAHKKVDSAAQSCPFEAKGRCEIEKLEVKASYVATSDATSTPTVTRLTAKKKRRGEPIPPSVEKKVGSKVVDLLAQYDLVIEALAGFPCKANEEGDEKPKPGEPRAPGSVAEETKAPANVCEIEVEAELEGECSVSDHPRLRMKVANATPMRVEVDPAPIHGEEKMRLEDATWKPGQDKVEIKEIVAPTFKADIQGGDSAFGSLFRMIMWVWNANKSMDVELRAEACGVHSATESGTHDLIALVRVFRDISVAFGIKVPPVKKVSVSSERTMSLGGSSQSVKAEVTDYSKDQHATVTAEANESGFKGTAVLEKAPEDQFALYFKLNELEFLIKETVDKTKEQAEALHEATKNAHEKYKDWSDERAKKAAIDRAIKDALSDFLTFRDKVQLFFDDFVHKVRAVVDAITHVLDLMKKAPQLGFKLTFEVGFLSGDFFFGWSHSQADSSAAKSWPLADRFAPLLHKLHVESKLTIVTFKVEASFGLLISAGAIGKVEARVAGSIDLEVTWQVMLDAIVGSGAANGKGSDVLTQQITGKSEANLRATVEAKLAIWSYKREVGIESGIQVDGRVEWAFLKNEVKYSLNLCTLETGWYFYATDVKTNQASVTRHTIFEARPIIPRIEHTERL